MNLPSAEISKAVFQCTVFHTNFTRYLAEPEHEQSKQIAHPNNPESVVHEYEDFAEPVIARLKPRKFCSISSAPSSSSHHPSSVNRTEVATAKQRDSAECNRLSLQVALTRFVPVEALKKDASNKDEEQVEPQQCKNGSQRLLPKLGESAEAPQPGINMGPGVCKEEEPASYEPAAEPEDDEHAADLLLEERAPTHLLNATPSSSRTLELNHL